MVNIIRDGDIFTVASDIIIIPVDRSGGIIINELTRKLNDRFLQLFNKWKECGIFPMPESSIFYARNTSFNDDAMDKRDIIFFPVKHTANDLQADTILIRSGLNRFSSIDIPNISQPGLTINMPPLGCDNDGGLDFEKWLKPLVIDSFNKCHFIINLFEPK